MSARDPTRRGTRVPRLLQRAIQQRRRLQPAPEPSSVETGAEDRAGVAERLQAFDTRLQHLENLVEGLQDSVYRESARQQRRIENLERRRAT